MAVTITVESTDRTSAIEYDSLSLRRALTNQVDTFNFRIIRAGATGWKPSVLDEIQVDEDGTTIFNGTIIQVDSNVDGMDTEIINVQCKDRTVDLDRQMVVNVYEDQTVDSIIDDIITNFTDGTFTTTNVNAPVLIGYIAFNYEYPSQCLRQLAELINYDWYIDVDDDIHFFAKETTVAPFNLDDTGGKYYFNSLKVTNSIKDLRNTIVVRGGTYEGATSTETQNADGNQTTFTWAYKYSNVSVTVASVSKTVGIDNIDSPASFDCLYNYNEKALKFPSGSKPTAGQAVALTGNPQIPVICKVEDPASVATYGVFEYKVIDKSINSKEGARDRARAELSAWASELTEAQFETKETGLAVGQTITVQSTIRGIDETYVINRIDSKMQTPVNFLHRVGLVTTRTYGMIQFLQDLLTKKDKEIVISSDEVLDVVKAFSETITITESTDVNTTHNPQTETVTISENATVQALDYAVTFDAGTFTPDTTHRTFILDGSPLG